MNHHNLPNKLKKIIASEKTDFIVKSSKQQSIAKTLPALIFSILFIAILGFIIFKFINPIIEKELLDTSNIVEIENWTVLVLPAIVLGIFIVIAIGFFIKTLSALFSKGKFFVGTENQLIIYNKGTIITKEWKLFSGKIKTEQKHNYGNLILELKAKKATNIIVDEDIYDDNVDEEFVSETIEMIGIRNLMTIESKCTYRIEQHNNTIAS